MSCALTVSMRRRLFVLIVSVLFAAPPILADSRPTAWQRDPKNPELVRGQVSVATPPTEVWRRVSDVPAWPKLFSDILHMKVLRHQGEQWRIQLETRTFTCGEHEYDVRVAGRKIRTVIDAPGIEATALFAVEPGPKDGSIAHYDLSVRATGIYSWFISKAMLRQKQEAMVQRYLADLERTFHAQPKGK